MNWAKALKKGGSKRTKKPVSAYEIEHFLNQYPSDNPKEILQKETNKSLAVIATIRDYGKDERNRLKAANSLLDRTLPRVEKHEIEGNLNLEARLSKALEGEKEDNETK